jgi:hypothetical protein
LKSRTRHAGLKQELPNFETPPGTTNADAKEDRRTILAGMTSAATETEEDDSSHGKGATAGAEGTAASHSRDTNGAGIANADANEDMEAIAGSTNTDHGSRV